MKRKAWKCSESDYKIMIIHLQGWKFSGNFMNSGNITEIIT